MGTIGSALGFGAGLGVDLASSDLVSTVGCATVASAGGASWARTRTAQRLEAAARTSGDFFSMGRKSVSRRTWDVQCHLSSASAVRSDSVRTRTRQRANSAGKSLPPTPVKSLRFRLLLVTIFL